MRALVIALAAAAALAAPMLANAAPPPNDAFGAASPVAALPFVESVDASEATAEPGEPQVCWTSSQTAWWSFIAPASGAIRADLGLSGIANSLNVYRSTGAAISNLSFLGCGSFGSPVTTSVVAGETYYLQAHNVFGSFGSLTLRVVEVPPPPNDDFADAAVVSSLPYADERESVSATVEPGEPTSPAGPAIEASTWYAFTAPETRLYVVDGAVPCQGASVAAYKGQGLGTLCMVGASPSSRLLLAAQAGTSYSIQLGRGFTTCSGTLRLSIHAAQPPNASFWSSPSDPSSFDTMQFSNASWDPEGAQITSVHWDLGDGTTAEGWSVSQRYARDGDYEVRIDVGTADGRTGSVTRTIQVRTHDLAVAKLTVPQSAAAGQTRSSADAISNARYPETVTVRLLRSLPGGGWDQVGSLTQSAPARAGGRATSFAINYTFTAADAAIGKVTFRAIAELNGARDALPADNDVAALATKVSR
jgi:hypothetical protein